jgi:rfaE bifunctional protein nucleotidyltransferase chain/domain
MAEEKIKRLKEIIRIAENLKKKGKKIATISGSFDILHNGHIQLLKEAKKQGDILLVLLNSDKSIKGYKGPLHPINSQKNRAQILSSLESVDFVLLFDDLVPNKILEKIKPNIHCNGQDWGKNCIEKETVEKYGGKIHILKWKKGFSTSSLVKRILEAYSKPEVKAVFLDRDGTINENGSGYIHKIEDFKFIPGVIPALQELSKTDYKIIVVSNQSGIGRGYFKEEDLEKLNLWMVEELKKNGVRIDKIYYCPHNSEDHCSCRKPNIGLLKKAAEDFGINLSKSWVIGNEEKDIIMGKMANTGAVMVTSDNNLLKIVKNILKS